MSASERQAFDAVRLVHHSSFEPVMTPAMRRIHDALRLQAETNLHHPAGARPGSVIDGDANIGKTTIVTQFGRHWERSLRRRYPDWLPLDEDEFLPPGRYQHKFVPVVYVTLAAATTIKGLNVQILKFYGHPFAARETQVDLTMKVQNVARRSKTTLVIFDDVHYLRLGHQSDRDVNDYLKHLASTIAATFVYAGIDCKEGGLLREGRSRMDRKAFSQTGSRFTLHRVDTFRIDTKESLREWIQLLAEIEKNVVLMHSSPGMLWQGRMKSYLFERTHGEIGALTSLVRQGALLAIRNGEERITSRLLDEIELSFDAEEESKRRATRQRVSARRSTKTRRPKRRTTT